MNKNQDELELEQILREIEEDERLQDVTVPESVTRNIYAQIAAYEAAVSEIEPIEATMNQTLEERFPNMTPEERIIFQEAMNAQKKKASNKKPLQGEVGSASGKVVPIKRKRKKRNKKVYFLVAAVVVLVMATGIVGVGTDYKWLQVWDNELSDDVKIGVESEGDIVPTESMDEKEAYGYATGILGERMVTLISVGDELEYDSILINEWGMSIHYLYQGKLIQYNIMQNKNKVSHYEIQTGELQEEYIVENNSVEITIQQYEEADGTQIMKGTYTYNNLYYSITGMIEEQEFVEIMENIIFF